MKDKYLLLSIQGEIITPVLYDSPEEARKAMKAAIIDAMEGHDDTIFDKYEKFEEYSWEPDGNYAWLNYRYANCDWRIVSIEEIETWTAYVKEMQAKRLPGLIGCENKLLCSHGGRIPETNEEWNDLQRKKIAAFYEINDKAYICKINLHDAKMGTTPDTVFTEYTGQRVYNFGADFIVPAADSELAELIIKRNNNTVEQSLAQNLLDSIYNRVEEIGGITLLWS